MTQKEIHEFLADTKVYVAGKSREIQEKLFQLGYCWFADDEKKVSRVDKPFIFIDEKKFLSWSDDMNYFSRKDNREITAEQILALELNEPSYRPFKDNEECWNEMLKHQPVGWIQSRIGIMFNVWKVENIGIIIYQSDCGFDCALNDYTFADGTPFGIKED